MQILRLLAARRALSTTTASSPSESRHAGEDDQGPFFDLDFSPISDRTSSSGSSDSDSDESCAELDFIISLQRSSPASPLKFCASESPARGQHGARKRGIGSLRSMSFGARKATPLYRGGRPSFVWTSSGRHSFSSARSVRLFVDSPPRAAEDDEAATEKAPYSWRAPSRDVIRRCIAKISHRLRAAATSPRVPAPPRRKGSVACASADPRRPWRLGLAR